MTQALETRAARVSLVTGASTVLAVGMQIVTVPICVKYWGQATYGLWLTMTAALMLTRSLDAGYVAYVSNRVNYLFHVDEATLRRHLSSAVIGTTLVGAIQIALAVGIAASELLAGWVGLTATADPDFSARLGLVVLIVSWVITGSYLGVVHRLLIPAGMMYQAAWWGMLFQLTQFGIVLVAAISGLGILETSAICSAAQALVYVASGVYIKRKLPRFFPWWRGSHLSVALRDLLRSAALSFGSLVQQGTSNGTVLLVAALSGAAAVPVFTTVRTLANLWTMVTNTLTAPLLGDVVRFHATGELQKVRRMVQAHWVIAGTVVNLTVVLAYPLIPFVYSSWTHGMRLDKWLLSLLLCAVLVANLGALISLHLNGINNLRVVVSSALIRCVLSLGGGAVAYHVVGVAGIGLAILAGETGVLLFIGSVFLRLSDQHDRHERLSVLPALLGVTSAGGFLLADAAKMVSTLWALPPTVLCIAASAVVGWKQMPADVRLRIARLSRFPGTAASAKPI